MPEEDYDIYGEYEAYTVGRANQVGILYASTWLSS